MRAFPFGALLLVSSTAAAAPLRVVVRTVSETDRDLVARIRGQASDLDVAIEEAAVGALEAGLPAQLAAADVLAGRDASTAVVWFDRDPHAQGALLVVLSVPAQGRVLARRVDDAGRSAALESAALIVRSALQALAEGATIGVAREEVAPEAPPAAPTLVEIHPVRRAPSVSSGWVASLGWQAAIDGHSPYGQQGLAGRFAWTRAWLELGAFAAVGLPAEVADAHARLALSRRTFAVTGAARVPGPRIHLVLGLALGASAFARSTVSHDADVVPAGPSLVWAPLVGPEATLRWLPRFAGGMVALSLCVGADVVPGAPEIGYRVDGDFQPARRLWWIEPRAALALELVAG